MAVLEHRVKPDEEVQARLRLMDCNYHCVYTIYMTRFGGECSHKRLWAYLRDECGYKWVWGYNWFSRVVMRDIDKLVKKVTTERDSVES